MKLSIIMPAHNEENRIGQTLKQYSSYFESIRKKTKDFDYEFVIVINATTDNTEKVVKSYSKKNKRIVSINLRAGGKGYAVLEGFKDALKRKNDLIGFVDADMATPPASFYSLVKSDSHDGAIASRWIKGSIIKDKQTILRRINSKGFNVIVRSLFIMPYRDTQCGAKVFKRQVVSKIIDKISLNKWAFDVELLYQIRKNNFILNEEPTLWDDKKGSKLNLIKVPFQMFASVVRLRLIHSPFKFIVSIYDRLPERIKIHR